MDGLRSSINSRPVYLRAEYLVDDGVYDSDVDMRPHIINLI